MINIKKISAVVLAAAAAMLMQTAVWANITAIDWTDTTTNTEGKMLKLSGTVTLDEVFNYSDKGNVLWVMSIADAEMPEDCHGMFNGYTNLRYVDLNYVKKFQPTYLNSMFAECSNLVSVDLSGANTKNVTDMSNMFLGCTNLPSVDISGFDTSNVKDMNRMFYNCENLTSVNFGSINTSSLTNMGGMFCGCAKLPTIDLKSFDTSNVKIMSMCFYGCAELTSLDLSNFNTSKVENMSHMFNQCKKLSSVDVSSFDTRNVIYMESMFCQNYKLKKLDLSSFDTSSVTTMKHMFQACTDLEYIDMSRFSAKSSLEKIGMFEDCNVLGAIKLGGNFKSVPNTAHLHEDGGWLSENGDTVFISDEYAVIDRSHSKRGLYLSKNYINKLISVIGGSGTEEDPYIISDYDTLRLIIKIYDKFKKEDVYIKLLSNTNIVENLRSGYEPIEITGGETVYLDVNGQGLIQNSVTDSETDCMFNIVNGKMTLSNNSAGSKSVICKLVPGNTSSDAVFSMFRVRENGQLEINSGKYDANYSYNTVIETTPRIYHKSPYDTEYEITEGCPVGALKINGGEFYTRNEALLTCGVINNGIFHGSYRFSDREESNGVFMGYIGASGHIYNMKILKGSLVHKDGNNETIDQNSGVMVDGVSKTRPYSTAFEGDEIIIGKYKVTFDSNGGTGTIEPASVKPGDSFTLPKCTFTPPENYDFAGWEIGLALYDEGEAVDITEDTVVKAKWGRHMIVKFFDSWSGSTDYVYTADGKELVLPNCMFTAPEGKQFSCWERSGISYNAGEKVTITEDTEFLAVWETKKCTVTFDTNGMGIAPAPETVLYGGHPHYPSVPDVNDYYVSGWYKDAACTQAFSFENYYDAITDDITLYAKWEKKDNTLVFSLTEEKTATVYYGDDIKMTVANISDGTNYIMRIYYYNETSGKYECAKNKAVSSSKLPLVFTADDYKEDVTPETKGVYLECSSYQGGSVKNNYEHIYLTVKYKQGDFNKNGKLDEEDAAMLLKHLSGSTQLDEEQYERADVNGDGYVDMRDVVNILTEKDKN